MMTRKELYDRSVEELVKKHRDEITKQIENTIRLEDAVKKLDKKWNAYVEIERINEYGPRANVVLKPNEEIWKEVEELIEERKISGPHLYFNSGDDWRRYLTTRKDLAPLMLSTKWDGYFGYEYNRRTKEVRIPMYECGVTK